MDSAWSSVNSLLESAQAQLKVGELLHGDGFSLFEAMSAIEIGNPKMDAAVCDKQKPLAVILEEGAAPESLNIEQTIAIMDYFLVMEATWHTSSPLAQTVFTCLYLLYPARCSQNPFLSAYCMAIKSTCQLVRSFIMQGSCCEEEDFNPNTFGLPMSEACILETDEIALYRIRSAVDLAESVQSRLEKGALKSDDIQLPGTASQYSELVDRLLLRFHFYHALCRLAKRTLEDTKEAVKLLASAQLLMEKIHSSTESYASHVIGFVEDVNQGLAGPAPPRAIQVLTVQQTFDYFSRLLKQLQQGAQVVDLSSWTQLYRFVEEFSTTQASALARSVCHTLLTTSHAAPDGGKPVPAPWAMSWSMVSAAIHVPPWPKSRKPPPEMELFLEQAMIAVSNWVQVMMMNRCRQRRRLRRGLSDDWCNLLGHAVNTDGCKDVRKHLIRGGWKLPEHEYTDDNAYFDGPLCMWVEQCTCRVMVQHVMLGFDLGLYQPKEYLLLYWYVDYLLSVMATNMSTTISMRQKQLAGSPQLKGSKPVISHEARTSMVEQFLVEVQRYMAHGSMWAAKAMCVQNPEMPYNTELQRFDQRFASFHHIHRPVALTYAEFFKWQEETSTVDALEKAESTFKGATQIIKQLLEHSKPGDLNSHQIAELLTLEKLATRNSVVASILRRVTQQTANGSQSTAVSAEVTATTSDSTTATAAAVKVQQPPLDMTVEFSQHPWYPALVLPRSKNMKS